MPEIESQIFANRTRNYRITVYDNLLQNRNRFLARWELCGRELTVMSTSGEGTSPYLLELRVARIPTECAAPWTAEGLARIEGTGVVEQR